jgi:hypothetical protein
MAHIGEQILVWEIDYVAGITDYSGGIGTGAYQLDIQTLYFSTRSFTTAPDDVPSSQFYDGRIIDPGSMNREMFQGTMTSGRSISDYGLVEVANTDGALDYLWDVVSWGFDATLKILQPGSERIDTATPLMTVTVLGIESGDAFRTLRFRIRDRMAILDNPLQEARYGGGGGADGGAGLEDRLKPGIYGQVWEVPCILIDAANLVYQVNYGTTTFQNVRDGGLALTSAGSVGTTYADLIAAGSPPGGFYYTVTDGMFRLGAVPALALTADCTGTRYFGLSNAAMQVYEILLWMGIESHEVDLVSINAVLSFNSANVGIYIDSEMPAIEAISFLLDSIGASLIYSFRLGIGQFRLVYLFEPTGIAPSPPTDPTIIFPGGGSPDYYAAIQTYTLADIIQTGFTVSLAATPDSDSRAVWKVIIKYSRNYNVLDESTMVGALHGTDAANFFNKEWFAVEAIAVPALPSTPPEFGVIFIAGLLPTQATLTFETGIFDDTAAAIEAQRRVELYSVRRDRLTIPLSFAETPDAGNVELGDQVLISMDRFGYDQYSPTGKPFIVIGRKDDYKARVRTLILWG